MDIAGRVRRTRRLAIVACLGLMWPARAAAQEPPSVGDAADRPGYADSAVLVGRGHILFETGLTLQHDGDDRASARTLTWPQVELHGGLTSWLDAAVIWDGVVSTWTHTSSPGRTDDDTTTGLDDFRVGAKLRLVRRPRLNAAFVGYVNVPVGSDVVSRRYADPLVRLAWSVAISDRVSVAGTVDLQAAKEDDGDVRAKPAASAALSCGFTDALSGFAGLVAEPAALASRPGVWSIEGGLIRAIGDRHQVDLWLGRHINGDIDGWFVSGGVIRRLR
ncbi:MAG TPA: transporter [Vicinamibacterales bacterium]|nr:transporter [Vicinamibacterales bacterium]